MRMLSLTKLSNLIHIFSTFTHFLIFVISIVSFSSLFKNISCYSSIFKPRTIKFKKLQILGFKKLS